MEKGLLKMEKSAAVITNSLSKTYFNWSGGKDSSLALYYILQQKNHGVSLLLTSLNAVQDRVSVHGVRRYLLEAQSKSLNIPFITIEMPEEPDMATYETILSKKIRTLKQQGFTHTIFGDIFLEDLRKYREDKLEAVGIKAIFPLWKIDTAQLMKEFLALGFKAIVVCVNEQYLNKSFCGRIIDEQFIKDLPEGIDVCGENGEYHSFVFDGPIFKNPIAFTKGELVYKEYKAPQNTTIKQYGFWFCDLL